MKKAQPLTATQGTVCTNPECGRTFDNPIVVQDITSKHHSSYQGCPYCLTEIPVVEETTKRRSVREVKAEAPKTPRTEPSHSEVTKSEELGLADEDSASTVKCSYHFGYLGERSERGDVPEGCMTCEKIVQCMLKKLSS